jgi:hypothetical protein
MTSSHFAFASTDRCRAARERYWRGLVFSEFDGKTWSRESVRSFPWKKPTHSAAAVGYTVTLEPTGQRMLFALDLVDHWTPVWPCSPGITRCGRPGRSIRCCATTQRRIQDTTPASNWRRTFATSTLNCLLDAIRARPHSRRAARSSASDADYIRAVLRIFREQEFYYTLSPPGLERDSWMTSCSTRAGFLRAFRLGIHGAHARCRHPGAHRRRLPGRRLEIPSAAT